MLSAASSRTSQPDVVELPTGLLRVEVNEAAWPLDSLCGFAARNNPKRGFLIVSRVLGRHIPAAPDLIGSSARDLACLVPDDLPGPILVVGLAETAICLGQIVHRELRERSGRDDICFIHSTRQRFDHPLLCRFEEPHSHASDHLIYQPDIPGFAPPRTLLLVDDEISTGTTLANLAAALVGCWPGVQTIVAASLTDWSAGAWLDQLPRPARSVSLLSGTLTWTARETAPNGHSFQHAPGSLGRLAGHRNFGRLGLGEPLRDLPATPPTPKSNKLRIVATGEFTFPPFMLAERLQRAGHDVVVQATGRSPVRLGGAIERALSFKDNYETSVPNYLYNAGPEDGRETWICHETPAGSIDPVLVKALDAHLVGWCE